MRRAGIDEARRDSARRPPPSDQHEEPEPPAGQPRKSTGVLDVVGRADLARAQIVDPAEHPPHLAPREALRPEALHVMGEDIAQRPERPPAERAVSSPES